MLKDPAQIRVAAVAIALVVVLGISFFGGVAWWLHRLRRRRFGRWEREIATGAWALSGLGALCFAYGHFVEPLWVDITRDNVVTTRLRDGERFRIVHISDLHVEGPNRLLSGLAGKISSLRPDMVIFTGDALNNRDGLEVFRTVLSSSEATIGRYAVRGNQDVGVWAEVDLFGGGVAKELRSTAPVLMAGGRIALCGAPYGKTASLETCLSRAPRLAFKLLAYHSPDLIEELRVRPDLYLAGHTHGGQVRLPKYGALVTHSKHDKKYEMGRYEVDGTVLYVNRGIGTDGGWLPGIRFMARP
ncbi:MAG: metallophosphoesterase, partial [Myxococcaceae bacterium]